MDTIKVKIADLAVLKGAGFLITVGLGSCVGIAIYDEKTKVAGLAHILLSDSEHFKKKKHQEINLAKFADTAIPELIKRMQELGGRKPAMVAKIAGGSQLFNTDSHVMRVGQKNIEMVRKKLNSNSIPLVAEDVGGNYGRTMKLEVATGKVIITTVGRDEKIL